MNRDKQVNEIIKLVNNHYGVDCREETRRRGVLIPRQIAMDFIHKNIDKIGLKDVGEYFNKDHATVIYSLKAVKNIKESDFSYDRVHKHAINSINPQVHWIIKVNGEKEMEKIDLINSINSVISNYNLLGLNNLIKELVINPN